MKLLLDTHILLWWLLDSEPLSQTARNLISDPKNEIYYSILSILEVELKYLAHPDSIDFSAKELLQYCEVLGFHQVNLTGEHILGLKALQRPENVPAHKDPFDRLLLCQAKAEGMVFLTHDRLIPYYQEACILSV